MYLCEIRFVIHFDTYQLYHSLYWILIIEPVVCQSSCLYFFCGHRWPRCVNIMLLIFVCVCVSSLISSALLFAIYGAEFRIRNDAQKQLFTQYVLDCFSVNRTKIRFFFHSTFISFFCFFFFILFRLHAKTQAHAHTRAHRDCHRRRGHVQ